MEAVTSNPIDGDQLIHALMCGRKPSQCLEWINDDLRQKLTNSLNTNADLFPPLPQQVSWEHRTQDWLIPKQYLDMDIEQYILSLARDNIDLDRINWELEQFRTRNLIPVLRTIKYLVDLMQQHDVVWGVGRGSSVSSLILFLLGVHRIDPIKWKLDAAEFFK